MPAQIKFDLPMEKSSIIKVIGVGGGGSNAVNHMYRQGIVGVDFYICNTDSQALEKSPVPNKIQIGNALTSGLGAGGDPEMGKKAAIESIDELINLLGVNTKMVFITAGMGGGTGTGAAPIIAKTAKDLGILTVGIVTTPFTYEGPKRKQQGDDGLAAMKSCVDALLIISNDKIKEMFGKLKLSQAFAHADNVLTTAAKGIAEIITLGGDMNVDFEDVRTAMQNSGVAIMGTGVAEGQDRALDAAHMSVNSPLLTDNRIEGAKNILINISYGEEEPDMDEITSINEYFQNEAGFNANLKFGHSYNEVLGKAISVTIIATGFESKQNMLMDEPKAEVYEAPQAFIQPMEETPVEVQPIINEVTSPQAEDTHTEADTSESGKTFRFVLDEETEQKPQVEDVDDERIRKIKERILHLRNLNNAANNPHGMQEMEKVPAFSRRGIKLDQVPHSSENQVSRYTLVDEPDKKPEIRPNNSFLHDNVD